MQDAQLEPPKARRDNLGNGSRILLTITLSMIILFGLQYAKDVLVPIIMAGFLAIISYSITDALRKYLRFPHWLAVFFTVIVDFGVIFGVISLINVLATDFIQTFTGDLTQSFALKYNETMTLLKHYNMDEHVKIFIKSPQDIFDGKQLMAITQALTGQVFSFMSVCTMVLILMTFFLGEAPLFRRNMEKLSDNSEGRYQIITALMGIQRYLFIKTVSSLCTGALAWWLCSAMDLPFSFLWGTLAFVLNYIPTFGSIVAALPPILLGLLLGDWSDFFLITAGYVAINFVIGNGIEPLFLGKQFGIATSVVLLSVVLWGWVFGGIGMLLSVPITVLIKLALENSRDLAWLAIMISDDPDDKKKKNNLNINPID